MPSTLIRASLARPSPPPVESDPALRALLDHVAVLDASVTRAELQALRRDFAPWFTRRGNPATWGALRGRTPLAQQLVCGWYHEWRVDPRAYDARDPFPT